MELSSPRTWLIIAAGVLVLAGVVVIYVIKNPPLPPGWKIHEEPGRFHVALPPGEVGQLPADGFVLAVAVGGSVGEYVEISVWDFPVRDGETPEREIEDTIKWILAPTNPMSRVVAWEQVTVCGYPGLAYVMESDEPGGVTQRRKHMRVQTRIHGFDLSAPLAPGIFSEEEADRVFRSFRPK